MSTLEDAAGGRRQWFRAIGIALVALKIIAIVFTCSFDSTIVYILVIDTMGKSPYYYMSRTYFRFEIMTCNENIRPY